MQVALVAFLPTKADGAIGAVEYTPEARRRVPAAPLAPLSLLLVSDLSGNSLAAPPSGAEGPREKVTGRHRVRERAERGEGGGHEAGPRPHAGAARPTLTPPARW